MAAAVVTKPTKETKATKVKEITEEKERKSRPKHSLIGSSDTNVYPLKSVPADYDFETMQSLKRKDFADEATYFEYRAQLCDLNAKKFRSRAEEARTVGGAGEDKKLLKKVMREAAKLQQLKDVLGGKGIDVEALIKKAMSNATVTA